MKTWEELVLRQQQEDERVAKELQGMLDQSGISLAQIEEFAKIDPSIVDPQLLQAIELSGGTPLEKTAVTKPEANASNFRQRTRALSV